MGGGGGGLCESKNCRNAFKLRPGNNNDTYNASGKPEFIWFSSYRDIGQKRNSHTKSLKNLISCRLLDLLTSRLGVLWWHPPTFNSRLLLFDTPIKFGYSNRGLTREVRFEKFERRTDSNFEQQNQILILGQNAWPGLTVTHWYSWTSLMDTSLRRNLLVNTYLINAHLINAISLMRNIFKTRTSLSCNSLTLSLLIA